MTEESDSCYGLAQQEYRRQAEFISRVATALAEGRIPPGERYAAMQKLWQATDTLRMWTLDDRA